MLVGNNKIVKQKINPQQREYGNRPNRNRTRHNMRQQIGGDRIEPEYAVFGKYSHKLTTEDKFDNKYILYWHRDKQQVFRNNLPNIDNGNTVP